MRSNRFAEDETAVTILDRDTFFRGAAFPADPGPWEIDGSSEAAGTIRLDRNGPRSGRRRHGRMKQVGPKEWKANKTSVVVMGT